MARRDIQGVLYTGIGAKARHTIQIEDDNEVYLSNYKSIGYVPCGEIGHLDIHSIGIALYFQTQSNEQEHKLPKFMMEIWCYSELVDSYFAESTKALTYFLKEFQPIVELAKESERKYHAEV